MLENVAIDAAGNLDLDSDATTENTRAAYPIHQLANIVPEGRAGHAEEHPLPDRRRLRRAASDRASCTAEQAMYYFLSGYTAKVAGTERGIKEPQATFSACFGEPFLPLRPTDYAKMLGEKIKAHQPSVWLINTGWTAGPYGVGHRMAIPHTRAMIRAALAGTIPDASLVARSHSSACACPPRCPAFPTKFSSPRATWSDPKAYDAQATKLAGMFRENFKRYADQVGDDVKAAAPRG